MREIRLFSSEGGGTGMTGPPYPYPSYAARTTDQRAQRSAALVLAARTFSRSEMAGGSATDPVAALRADEGSGDVGAAPEDLAGRVLAPGGCSAAPFGTWATRRR
jgi:hypothetical protein